MNSTSSDRALAPVGRFEWEQVFRRVCLSPASVKLLGYTLATYADTTTGEKIRPGIRRLALTTGSSDRQVMRGLKQLEELGLVELLIRGSQYGRGGKGMASVYRLTLPSDLRERVEMVDPDALEQVTPVSRVPDKEVTPMSPDPTEDMTPTSPDSQEQVTPRADHVTSRAEQVTPRVGTGDTHVTPPPHESPLHETPPHKSSSAPSSTTSPAAVDNFAADDREGMSLDDRKNDQLARLRQWEAAQQTTDEHAQDTAEPEDAIEGEIVDGDSHTSADAFTRFWQAYPEDRKWNRGQCRDKFAELVKEGADPEHIVQGALIYRHDPNRLTDPAFTVAPLRWLEEERWESGPTPAPRTESQKRAFQGYLHMQSLSTTTIDTSDPWENPFEARAQRQALEEAPTDPWPATGTDLTF